MRADRLAERILKQAVDLRAPAVHYDPRGGARRRPASPLASTRRPATPGPAPVREQDAGSQAKRQAQLHPGAVAAAITSALVPGAVAGACAKLVEAVGEREVVHLGRQRAVPQRPAELLPLAPAVGPDLDCRVGDAGAAVGDRGGDTRRMTGIERLKHHARRLVVEAQRNRVARAVGVVVAGCVLEPRA